jgi:mRNA interferase RelE/StbE
VTIEWTGPAAKDIDRLDRKLRERIAAAVDRFATTGHGDVKALKGSPGEYRLRVGDWRVRFSVNAGKMRVERVLPRGGAYRD